jgi:hypothetical protein
LKYGKSRFVEVINDDSEEVMTKIAYKQVYYMMYPCPRLSAWWVVYKVNPHEPLHIPGDNCYRAGNLEDEENYVIIREDDLQSSFNVEIS